ncbi:MAG: type II toxin-antitoxin system VapC family toxin [Planctomycetaceae bacterium]|nr:type II toxin-antitoxin system VapC family toxin [Planctomycetaceae bacterium]
MKLLLDTHVFLWYITADPKLPTTFQTAIQDSANSVFLSVVSIWEAVIKHQLGKLTLPAPPAEFLPRQRDAHGMASLPIEEGSMPYLAGLPQLHRDPFDRLLVAQSLQFGLTILTVDPDVQAYPIALLPSK